MVFMIWKQGWSILSDCKQLTRVVVDTRPHLSNPPDDSQELVRFTTRPKCAEMVDDIVALYQQIYKDNGAELIMGGSQASIRISSSYGRLGSHSPG